MVDKPFRGKVALVTGGSRGIGKAISLKLASLGADVIINYLYRREAADATAAEISAMGVRAHEIKANIGDPEKIASMFREIETEFGKLDILINNAASGVARAITEVNVRGWDWTMNINARGALLCSQMAAKMMPDGGRIVNISSLGSRFVLPLYGVVGISKAALEALTRYLAVELAPRKIVVNGIAASAVKTEALKVYAGDLSDSQLRHTTPVGRMVEPEDISGVVAFLCSEEAYMIRGQIIIIDGGCSLASARYNELESGYEA